MIFPEEFVGDSNGFSAKNPRQRGLLADAELFLGDDGAVAVDVLLDQVVEKAATLADEGLKSTSGCMIFVI